MCDGWLIISLLVDGEVFHSIPRRLFFAVGLVAVASRVVVSWGQVKDRNLQPLGGQATRFFAAASGAHRTLATVYAAIANLNTTMFFLNNCTLFIYKLC